MSPAATHIVLIHGLWLAPHSWRGWIDRYTAAGHIVHAPEWPGVSAVDEELDTAAAPHNIGIAAATDHFARLVSALPEAPVIIGHSMGGLITQLLLQRGLGRAGVAIQPAKPRALMRLPLTMLRATAPVLRHPANRGRVVMLSPRQFHYAFANTLSQVDSDDWYRRLAIPAPGRPIFEAALSEFTPKSRAPNAIDFAQPDRAPLLLVAGDRDHLMPEPVVYENFNRYRRSPAQTALKVFHHRPHLITVLDGWEDVADHVLSWALAHTG